MHDDRALSPGWYLGLGFGLAAFGCPAYFAREAYDAPAWLGPLLLLAALVFLAIGVVSIGVTLGITRAHATRPVEPGRDVHDRPTPY